MADSRQPILQRILQGCSSLLLWVGAVVFLVGGKFLYEVKHTDFLVAEGIGILGGVLLMLLGAGIVVAGKPPGRKEH